MKLSLLLLLGIILSTVYVLAHDEIGLGLGDSYIKDGINITFAKMDRSYDKVVLCVNNEKQILYEDQIAYFKNASLEILDIDRYNKSIEVRINWMTGIVNGECKEDCLNPGCRIELYNEFGEPIKELTEDKPNTIGTASNEESIENIIVTNNIPDAPKQNYVYIISLGIIGGIIGISLVWLLWFRQMAF